jgi:thiamine-phosphate pyrophosphorylase
MSDRHPAESKRVPVRLYLVTPPVEDAAAMARLLSEAVAAADVAAVLLRLADADERTLIDRVKTLLAPVQQAGAALLLDGRAELAVHTGADGAHLTGIDAFSDAVERLRPERIAGCGGLKTRHDAMVAAERGADYVMLGDFPGGQRPAFEAIVERVEWWANLFQIPCVGFAASPDEVGRLARAGAEFVAVGDGIWDHADGPAAAVAAAAQRLTAPGTVA